VAAIDGPTLGDCHRVAREIDALALDAWAFTVAPGPAVVAALLTAVPAAWRAEALDACSPGIDAVAIADWTVVVAAHAFASWPAYAGESLWSWLVSLEDVARLYEWTGRADGVDLIVRHLADSSALIEHWNREARRRYSSDMNGYR
jgi:hypothetical protein